MQFLQSYHKLDILDLFSIIFISRNRGANKEPETSLKSKNKIMLPMSGNILLYDMNVEIHSARLKVIYDSSTEEVEKEVVIEVEKSAAPISK